MVISKLSLVDDEAGIKFARDDRWNNLVKGNRDSFDLWRKQLKC